MKVFSIAAALTASAVQAISDAVTLSAVSEMQVNQRTLLNKWKLSVEYQVDAKEERSASENFIYITTVLSNSQVVSDYNRRIQDGEIF